jgi:hypothetical protein
MSLKAMSKTRGHQKNGKMKSLFVQITLAMFFSVNVSAMSCKIYVHFVVRCQQDVCKDGFFAHRKLAGSLCSTILDVPFDEPVRKFDGQLSRLRQRDSMLFDGYYQITIPDFGYRYDRSIENLRCFQTNENGELSLSCEDEAVEFERLDFPANKEVSAVIAEMANRARQEGAFDRMMDFALPVLVFAIMMWAGVSFKRASGNKLAASVFAVSLLGVPHVFWGREAWILSTLAAWIFCLVWLIAKLTVRYRNRKEH